MNEKTKVGVLMLVFFIIILVIVGVVFSKKNTSSKQPAQVTNQVQNTNQLVQDQKAVQPENLAVQQIPVPEKVQAKQAEINNNAKIPKAADTSVVISGMITKITDHELEIKNGQSIVSLALNNKLSVAAITGGKIEDKKISDVKVGDLVSVKLSKADTSIISIQIEEVK